MARSEDGRRCAEMGPRLSAFCDGEAGAAEQAELREHLRACAHCRATLRAYRAVPAAAAALAPALPLHRSLFERVQEAAVGLAARFGGGGAGEPVTQVAAAGGSRGVGMTALAKLLAVCAGTVGGAAACAATGVIPAPPELASGGPQTGTERAAPVPAEAAAPAPTAYEAEPGPAAAPEPEPEPEPEPPPATEPAPPPPTSGGAVEYTPPPPSPSPAPAAAPAAAGGGGPAGEFGP